MEIEYKSQNTLDWVGRIPNDWKVSKLKYLGALYSGLSGKSGLDFNQNGNPNNKPYIPFSNIVKNTRLDPNYLDYVVINESDNQNVVKKGDLFFLMSSENYEDVGRASILLDDLGEAYLNSFCKGYRVSSDEVNPRFLTWYLLAYPNRCRLSIEANGFTRINLKQDKVNNLKIHIPSLLVQTRIADYLDSTTDDLDTLIANNLKSIKLLEEKRSALINNAITKGLNPNIEMKDSGIEWIGKIPKDWALGKLGYYIDVRDGTHDTPEYVESSRDSYPLITSQNIVANEIRFDGVKYISKTDFESIKRRSGVGKGDLIMPMIGTIGNTAIVNNEVEFAIKNVALFKPQGCSSKYLYYYLESDFIKNQFLYDKSGGVQSFISLTNLRNLPFLVTNRSEQDRIVTYLDEKTANIDIMVNKLRKQNELIKEYKQSLIYHVVTGKVDVRDEIKS